MTQKNFDKFFKKLKEQEKKYGVKINFSQNDCRDQNHLDCFWYGGEVGSIDYKGYKIVIGAYGDIRVSGFVDGVEVNYKDKSNSGEAFSEFGFYFDDEKLYRLVNNPNTENFLDFTDNNWFEVDLIDPNGAFVDLCYADNVLENNILDCFSDVSGYFEFVDAEIERRS